MQFTVGRSLIAVAVVLFVIVMFGTAGGMGFFGDMFEGVFGDMFGDMFGSVTTS